MFPLTSYKTEYFFFGLLAQLWRRRTKVTWQPMVAKSSLNIYHVTECKSGIFDAIQGGLCANSSKQKVEGKELEGGHKNEVCIK